MERSEYFTAVMKKERYQSQTTIETLNYDKLFKGEIKNV